MLLFVLRKENAGVDVDLDFVSEGNGLACGRQPSVDPTALERSDNA